jgi:polyisoprenoid-binding protein YceI
MRIKILVLAVLFSGIFTAVSAQKYITKTGKIEIFSETPVFVIDGVNKKVASILNIENGDVVASTLVRSFRFEEALVEEHFNENYLEPNKFPKSIFKGKIADFAKLDLTKNGTHDIKIEGKLTIHGQTREISEPAKLIVKDGVITASSEFDVSLENYGVEIERAYKHAIKDAVTLKLHFEYKPYNS